MIIKKIFIKNYNDTSNDDVRQKYGVVAAVYSGVINLFLFSFKLVIGILSNSISIIGDAINNLTDLGSSVISFIGFKLSNKPADEDHPYGHQRIEYITSFVISIIILIVGFQLLITSINKIFNKTEVTYNYITLIILVFSIIIKLYLALFNHRFSKDINSTTLKAASKDSLNDCISTLAILISAIISIVLKINIDGYMGVLVSCFILISGISLAKETINPLIGEKTDVDLVKNIINDIKIHDQILGIHDVMCHSYGPTKIFMSLHAEVDSDLDVLISHELIDNIEFEIKNKYNVSLVIHMDPVNKNCEVTSKFKNLIDDFLKSNYSELSFHDFRTVIANTHINIIFDIVKPLNCKVDDEHVKNQLNNLLSNEEVKINLIITFEKEFSTIN